MKTITTGTLITNPTGEPNKSDVLTLGDDTRYMGVYRIEMVIDRKDCRAVVWLRSDDRFETEAEQLQSGPLAFDVPVEIRPISARDWAKKLDEEASPVPQITINTIPGDTADILTQRVVSALRESFDVGSRR